MKIRIEDQHLYAGDFYLGIIDEVDGHITGIFPSDNLRQEIYRLKRDAARGTITVAHEDIPSPVVVEEEVPFA